MKKLLLSALMLSSLSLSAQNILDEKVTFKYTQLSLTKIDDGSKTYAVDVQMSYLQRNDDSLKAYEDAKLMYANTLNAYLDVWEGQKKNVDRQHLTNMVIWESQVAAGNTAATQPVKPPYPAFIPPARPQPPFLLTEIQPASIIAAVNIDGMTQNSASTTKITLVFEGFEKSLTKLQTKGTAPALKYSYTLAYRHPVTVKVEVPGKGIIINQRIPETEGFRSWTSKEFKTKSELEIWWMDNDSLTWAERQQQVVFEMMPNINNYLTNNFGYPVVSRRVEVYSAKAKDADYTDVQTAYSTMESGLLMLGYPEKTAEAQSKIREAVGMWNNTLKESDINNKKARIDKWVTSAIYVNLAEAYIWLNDYANAEIAANKVLNIGINKYERDARALLFFIKDQKQRYDANK